MQKNLPYDITFLIKQISEDDEQAFRKFFDHYKTIFYATAFKMVQAAVIADDIVQEVFVTLWIKRKLVAAADCPKSYVFSILHNCIYAHFRKLVLEQKLKSKISCVEESNENPIEKILFEKETRTLLNDIINQLPPQQKLVFQLAKQDGFSRDKIATMLNISPNTVRNHLSTALQYLRNFYKKSELAIACIVIFTQL